MAEILTVDDIRKIVAQTARDFNIKSVSLFGSYADGSQTEESDIDLIVTFYEPSVSLFTIFGFRHAIEDLTGKKVDVIHAPGLKNSFITIDREIQLYEAV